VGLLIEGSALGWTTLVENWSLVQKWKIGCYNIWLRLLNNVVGNNVMENICSGIAHGKVYWHP